MDAQILLKVNSLTDFQKLNEFLETTSIASKIVSSNASYELSDHYYVYKPTQEFKDFCGGECLNRFGLISLSTAKETVLQYAKNNKIYNSTTILLDQTLSKILNTTEREISHEDVYMLIKNMFKKQ